MIKMLWYRENKTSSLVAFNVPGQFWFLSFDMKAFWKTQFNPILAVVDSLILFLS